MFDAFTSDGLETWRAEDGGRIAYHNPSMSGYAYQPVPVEVKDTLRRVFFLPDGLTGWAVGLNGWVIKTTNGGQPGAGTWSILRFNASTQQFPAVLPDLDGPNEDLQDVHFLNPINGWVAGRRRIWLTNDGGSSWIACPLRIGGPTSAPLTPDQIRSKQINIRSLDVLDLNPGGIEPMIVGLACSEPGYIWRTDNGLNWNRVFDIHSACASGLVPAPMMQLICEESYPPPANFEAWDIEMSRNVQNLALMVGGYGTSTGQVFASGDLGLTWVPEYHECSLACPGLPGCQDCSSLPEYNPDPQDPQHLHRHQSFRALYGLGIFNADNSAVAGGHDGQALFRPPGPAGGSVWLDRSEFHQDYLTASNAVVYPWRGAVASPLNPLPPPGFHRCRLTGLGGQLAGSSNPELSGFAMGGDPHPIQNIRFRDVSPFNTGWQMGQFFRLARTITEGVTWTEAEPRPALNLPNLRAMAFASDNLRAACVGDLDPNTTPPKPRILWTDDNGTSPWKVATVNMGAAPEVGNLNDVTWSSGQEFWAAGDRGLLMMSATNGMTWRWVPTNGGQDSDFYFKGIAFANSTTGVVVGKRVNPHQGVAFQIKTGVDQNFTDISPTDTAVQFIADVGITSDLAAWAVGERVDPTSGVKTGVLLRATFTGEFYLPFETLQTTPACQAGADLGGGALPGPLTSDVAVLNEVECGNGMIWAAGECGRVWRLTSTNWEELKGNTDTHILGMSSLNGGSIIYMGGNRFGQTGHCVVRYE